MIELSTQFRKLENFTGWAFVPYSDYDVEQAKNIHPFDVLRSKFSGFKSRRSYQQLKAYFACCQTVADNTNNPDFNTREKVDLQLRVKLGWIKETLVIDKRVQFIPRSISYAEMSHLEACNYFSRAIEIMANFLGVTPEELVKNADA